MKDHPLQKAQAFVSEHLQIGVKLTVYREIFRMFRDILNMMRPTSTIQHEMCPTKEEMEEKFWKGWRENGGVFLSMTESQLKKMIKEELIDLFWYVAALIRIRAKKALLQRHR